MLWQAGSHRWDTENGPLIMGILNVTPDSFSDGYPSLKAALGQATRLVDEGADILDIGGESTRPGSEGVSLTEELFRVLPVIRALHREFDIPLSVDTQKAEVARVAIREGISIVNHVSASLDFAQMLPVIAESDVGYVAMHMRERSKSMQQNPTYEDPLGEVTASLKVVAQAATSQAIAPERILFDPGIGFGKKLMHNLALMQGLGTMSSSLNRPLLLGISRKSWLENLLGPVIDSGQERDAHTVLASVLLSQSGVLCHRVHNVGLLKRALKLARSLGHETAAED